MAHLGLIGGLGVSAAVHYYQHIAAAWAARGVVPGLTMAHADLPTSSALARADRIDDLASYLAGYVAELADKPGHDDGNSSYMIGIRSNLPPTSAMTKPRRRRP
jgi:aspartate/glutamate racemase